MLPHRQTDSHSDTVTVSDSLTAEGGGQSRPSPVGVRRDNFYPAVKFFPGYDIDSMSRTVIFAVNFVINVFRTVTAWIVGPIYRQYTHTFTYTHICAQISR